MSNNTSQDFWCPINGDTNQPNMKILIPAICCGNKISVSNFLTHSILNSSYLTNITSCIHFLTYEMIWASFGPVGSLKIIPDFVIQAQSVQKEIKYGYNCKKCKEYYNYAIANQPDGTLLCWGCAH